VLKATYSNKSSWDFLQDLGDVILRCVSVASSALFLLPLGSFNLKMALWWLCFTLFFNVVAGAVR
jgi:hypothetical protein